MLRLLLHIKFLLEKKTESKPKGERKLFSKLILNGGKFVTTYICFTYLILLKRTGRIRVEPLQDKENLPIISLTSFPARINNLWMVIYCIYKQTKLPGKIVLALSKEEIPQGIDALPSSLRFFLDKGLEILWIEDNLRPHNKYYHARQKFPNRLIITIDDDLLYHPTTIERLLFIHKQFPDCICSNRIQQVVVNLDSFAPTKFWPTIYHQVSPSHKWLALGYSGVLYPPNFHTQDLYDKIKITQLSLMADDMWLKIQELLGNYKVVNGDYYAHPMTIPSSQKIALQKVNDAEDSRNDKYLSLLYNHYHFSLQNIMHDLCNAHQ